jgi:NitT/TauT family transport system substrate-binding protein
MVLVSFAASGSGFAEAQSIALRIATTPQDSGAELYYAADMGFFKDAGLDVRVMTMNSGAATAAGVASGALDIAQSAIPSIAVAREHGIPFVLIAPASLYSSAVPTSELVVSKTSTIRSARDLSEKIIAVNALKGIQQVAIAAWVDNNGGDSKTLKFVEIPDSAAAAALAQGRADAVSLSEPYLHNALETNARVLGPAFDGVAKSFLIGAWFCTSDFAAAHPDVIRKFAAVMARTARWANANHAASARILEKYARATVTASTPRVIYAERLAVAQIQPFLDASAKYGLLSGSLSAASLIAAGLND